MCYVLLEFVSPNHCLEYTIYAQKNNNIKDFDIKIEWVDTRTPEGKRSWEKGLRILARMIADAYTDEQREKRNTQLGDAKHSSKRVEERACSQKSINKPNAVSL